MKKYPLIGVSIFAVVVLILASLSNVVGFQSVQSSNQKVINDEVDQKDLLFQTIVDIANNKDIQRIILKSQLSREGFFNPDGRFSEFNTPVLTKNALKHMYLIGSMLSKIISKSRIHSMLEQYQVSNPGMQKEISAVIEKNPIINREITQLSNSECDCENEKTMNWSFPVICTLLFPLFVICFIIALFYDFIFWPAVIIDYIGLALNCFWAI